jgi:DNA-binding Lrp family transcriptional regulator
MDFSVAPVDLDTIDWLLLEELQRDASRSNQDLAAAVGVSPATGLRRVRRLVEQGLIERRVALLSPARLGAGLTAIAEITLDRQGAEHALAFQARATAEPAVQQCYRVSPGPDFVLIVQVNDMAAWNDVVQRLFTQDANVRNVKTYFSLERAKFEPALSLPQSGRSGAARRSVSRT